MSSYSYGDLLKAYYSWTATIDKRGYVKNQFDRNDKWFQYCDVRDEIPAGESKRRYLSIKEEQHIVRLVSLPH